MSIQRSVILLFGMLFLFCAGIVTAESQMSLQTGTAWLVAGSDGTSTITVTLTDTDGTPLSGETITLSCDPALGALSQSAVTTGADGTATATFRAGTMSGTATITATASYRDDNNVLQTVSSSCDQLIDHNTPYRLDALEYESEITVGSTTGIVLAMVDRYGNRIDSRREAETVRFQVGSPEGHAGILDGSEYADDVVLPVDADGYVTADFMADRVVGENIVYVTFPGTVAPVTLTIYGLGDAVPASIKSSVSPSSLEVPGDGKSMFTITYILKDAYGNPSGNRSVQIATSLKDEPSQTLVSNSDGVVRITYGPQTTRGSVTITAVSVDDPAVTTADTVTFTNTVPVDMLLTASPQTMPSLDVNSGQHAEIRAKVTDEKGNPVESQVVTFDLQNINYNGNTYCDAPYLEDSSATTDEDGYAIVEFVPGSFPKPDETGYSQTATGECDIIAHWGAVTRTMHVFWKNYPFLSVETDIDPETVEVNDTVGVTVHLRGDGWALQPDLVDAVLAVDRSGSMLYDDPDRMYSVREAAKKFVGTMTTQDQISVVSFGRKGDIEKPGEHSGLSSEVDNDYSYPTAYADYATVDLPLSSDFDTVNTTLDSLVPDYGTPLRQALYRSITELISGGRSGTKKAVVVLSDGDYNWYGDPLARGNTGSDEPTWYDDLDPDYYRYADLSDAEQNMATYAADHSIVIYAIGYADSISEGGMTTLRQLAESTGGKYYSGDAANIASIYTAIAGDLKTKAGVNTSVDLDFSNVFLEINGTSTDLAGSDVLQYVYAPDHSTYVYAMNQSESEPFFSTTLDQTDEWNAGQHLTFDVGNVYVGQHWWAKFRLKVLKPGNIRIFGPGSTITFNNGEASLDLPETYLSIFSSLNRTGFGSSILDVDNLNQQGSEDVNDFLQVGWKLNYTGNATATQRLYYSTDDRHTWNLFETLPPVSKDDIPAGDLSQTASLDVRELPAGYYYIRVHATAPDTPDAIAELPHAVQVGSLHSNKIKLE